MKHNNISIFIPNLGCPNMCSFCNQKTISGSVNPPDEKEVRSVLNKATEEILNKANTEIAFFGGSFTAIEKTYMLMLLRVAREYVLKYHFKGVRISTRPDAITKEILEILKEYNVTAIELGAQSMNDNTLKINYRGHTSDDIREASKLVKDYGFELGLQMMTGLYGEYSEEDVLYTANEIAKLNPDTVRIYPTVILKGTKLEELFCKGEYKPMTLEATVKAVAKAIRLFEKNSIRVIKIGLHSSVDVEKDMIGGVYHPAFRELCEGEIYFEKIMSAIKDKNQKYIVCVNQKELSKAKGQNKINEKRLRENGYKVLIKPDEFVKIGDVVIK